MFNKLHLVLSAFLFWSKPKDLEMIKHHAIKLKELSDTNNQKAERENHAYQILLISLRQTENAKDRVEIERIARESETDYPDLFNSFSKAAILFYIIEYQADTYAGHESEIKAYKAYIAKKFFSTSYSQYDYPYIEKCIKRTDPATFDKQDLLDFHELAKKSLDLVNVVWSFELLKGLSQSEATERAIGIIDTLLLADSNSFFESSCIKAAFKQLDDTQRNIQIKRLRQAAKDTTRLSLFDYLFDYVSEAEQQKLAIEKFEVAKKVDSPEHMFSALKRMKKPHADLAEHAFTVAKDQGKYDVMVNIVVDIFSGDLQQQYAKIAFDAAMENDRCFVAKNVIRFARLDERAALEKRYQEAANKHFNGLKVGRRRRRRSIDY